MNILYEANKTFANLQFFVVLMTMRVKNLLKVLYYTGKPSKVYKKIHCKQYSIALATEIYKENNTN